LGNLSIENQNQTIHKKMQESSLLLQYKKNATIPILLTNLSGGPAHDWTAMQGGYLLIGVREWKIK
jgi:hypothetical protein